MTTRSHQRHPWLGNVGLALFVGLSAALAQRAYAEPMLRQQVDQRGDFLLFGNTLGWDCGADASAVVVGQIACSNVTNTSDTAIDVYWHADDPTLGQSLASSAITMAEARSTAVLSLPPDARVTYARMYWAAYLPSEGTPDVAVTVEAPTGGPTLVTADATDTAFVTDTSGDLWYQGTAEVTKLLISGGVGAYRVSGIGSVDGLATLNNQSTMAGWSVVVFYQTQAGPPCNLALFDGLDSVASQASRSATLSGFLVPNSGYQAKLGVLAYEGDAQGIGDQLLFNGTALSDAVNPIDNFFNGTRSTLGNGASSAGDLPQLTGLSGSMGGMDLDVVDVTALVRAGDTSATIDATSSGDRYVLGAFVTSISTFKPDFSSTQKTVRDLNGGLLRPLDQLEYSISVINQGNDSSVSTVLTDLLPETVSYVPGTLEILSPESAVLTDTTGDDVGEFDATTRIVTARLGTSANAAIGGSIAAGATVTVRFRVTLDADAKGMIENQATITAGGLLGAPVASVLTNGNGALAGASPTVVEVTLGCVSDSDCASPIPYCAPGASPRSCVACWQDSHCADPKIPNCSSTSHSCECSTGPGFCFDSDGDGLVDGLELAHGTDASDADTDDDGVVDGQEPAWNQDSDLDGQVGALDADSDNDGIFDGTELGLACDNVQTDKAKLQCIEDADRGTHVTNPLRADSDDGGRSDGAEDVNKNGQVDPGERDPNLAMDDSQACVSDAECGGESSGQVCGADHLCNGGCRATRGNGCPANQGCSSKDDQIGQCGVFATGGAAGAGSLGIAGSASPSGGTSTSSSNVAGKKGTTLYQAGSSGVAGSRAVARPRPLADDSLLYGAGCSCRFSQSRVNRGLGLMVLGLLLLAMRSRTARRQSRASCRGQVVSASSTARTLLVKSAAVNGLARACVPTSSTPWCPSASSA